MEKKKGSWKWLEKFGAWIEKRIAPPLVKFGNQRHMAAIRSALIRIIPPDHRWLDSVDLYQPSV